LHKESQGRPGICRKHAKRAGKLLTDKVDGEKTFINKQFRIVFNTNLDIKLTLKIATD